MNNRFNSTKGTALDIEKFLKYQYGFQQKKRTDIITLVYEIIEENNFNAEKSKEYVMKILSTADNMSPERMKNTSMFFNAMIDLLTPKK